MMTVSPWKETPPKAQEVETQDTAISSQGVSCVGTKGTQESDRQEQKKLSEGQEVRQENQQE